MKLSTLILLIFVMSLNGQTHKSLPTFTPKQDIYNILTYGAVGDSLTMNTKAIQDAIDACNSNGGGTVWIPAGNYITGTIRIKSNVTLSLDYGACLMGSQDILDYATDLNEPREGSVHCLIYAENANNITIEGLGEIDGRGTPEAFPRERDKPRPRLIRMVNCDQLTFSGITYRRPAFWGIHLIDSKNIHFNGIKIRFRNNGYNNDGLDLDGCEDVVIENCDIDTGDDGICLKSSLNPCKNILIRACRVSSNTSPLKFGTSSRGGFINVTVTNCYFYDCPMGAIKLELVDGGCMENINISRIVMEDVGNPIFIRLGNRGSSFDKNVDMYQNANKDGKPEGMPVGTIKNIRISDVVATVTKESREKINRSPVHGKVTLSDEALSIRQKTRSGPIMITGIPGHYIEDVVLENITISYPGGGSSEDAAMVVAEDETRYPEQFFFGVLPSWGAYIRHARNIEFKNVVLRTRSPDKREKIVLDDVEGFKND